MPLPANTQVLIVGAGPTGMACALTLRDRGQHVAIVDAFQKNKDGSRAVVIHARTLEVLKTIGLASSLLAAGIQAKGVTICRGRKKLIEVNVQQLHDETEYPTALLIPQYEVERILQEGLVNAGVEILRPHAVVSINEAASRDGLDVNFDDGSCVRCQYVVGADGSRSTVRRLANIEFRDPVTGLDYDGRTPPESTFKLALADVYLNEPVPVSIPRDVVSFDLDKWVFACPLPSAKDKEAENTSFWRISIGMASGGPRVPDIDFLQAELNSRFPFQSKIQLASVETASLYEIKSAVASTLFKKIGEGNVLLVGDAAHVHSPAGGQGLNLGLCDAVSLGRAIYDHVEDNSKVGVGEHSDLRLTEYSVSRRKVAIRVVGMAQGLTSLGRARGLRKILRNVMLWIAGRTPFLRRMIAWRISGLINRDG